MLCHAVLEVVDDPAGVVAAIAAALRPGGAASVLVAGRAAAVLARAISGHLDAAAALLADPDGRAGPRDTLRRRYDAEGAAGAAAATPGSTVEEIHGVRVSPTWCRPRSPRPTRRPLLDFELAAAARPPYRDIATQLHLFARRP